MVSDRLSAAAATENRIRQVGFLCKCQCGGRLNLATATGLPHIGRLQYRCEFAIDGQNHTTKWWDEAVKEELMEISSAFDNQERRIAQLVHYRKNSEFGPEIHRLNTTIAKLSRSVTDISSSYASLQKEFNQRSQIHHLARKLHNFVMANPVVIIACCLVISLFANVAFWYK